MSVYMVLWFFYSVEIPKYNYKYLNKFIKVCKRTLDVRIVKKKKKKNIAKNCCKRCFARCTSFFDD